HTPHLPSTTPPTTLFLHPPPPPHISTLSLHDALPISQRPGIYANAHMAPRDLRAFCRVSDGADALLRTAITRLGLSARAYHRILDRKSTRLNSSHDQISYAVFCLKKKNKNRPTIPNDP